MATAAAKKGAPAQGLDPAAKKKVIIACVLLGLAAVLIAWNLMSSGGNPNEAPVLTPQEQQQAEDTHKQEKQKVIEQSNEGYRGGQAPPNPSGS